MAEGRAFIAQQQRLIVEAERDGEDATGTFRVLEKFLILQQSREQERARILDAISETIASTPPKPAMKAVTSVSFVLALILASPGDAKDIIDASTPSLVVAPLPHPDRPHLKRGDLGGDVPILQKALNNHVKRLTVDGIFGLRTERAVKDFQAESGLETTGEVDSGTWSALATKPASGSNPAGELETARLCPTSLRRG